MLRGDGSGPLDEDQAFAVRQRIPVAGRRGWQMKGAGPTTMQGQRSGASPAAFDCATAFQRIALDCVAKVRLQHSSACAGDAEAVHLIRVAITRLRAAVSFFAAITD